MEKLGDSLLLGAKIIYLRSWVDEEGAAERERDDDERQPNEDENEPEEEESDEEFPDVQIQSEAEENYEEDTKIDNEGENTSEVNEAVTSVPIGGSVDVAGELLKMRVTMNHVYRAHSLVGRAQGRSTSPLKSDEN
ncbi:hypothetical protein L211DRAFT_853410 [Terfezia boudieri ATCC MYA-4762]|uniref:Uncharacterized protein n=1 Tax=Terfezia boudieri ATCC MYA-4762 TaxID=1051890 RepID=A0A3N4L8K2_9PEZI|nr:hypothetical protein L211DRAFT_853410 [Terfezia boudieri ATCC MYA-4762]